MKSPIKFALILSVIALAAIFWQVWPGKTQETAPSVATKHRPRTQAQDAPFWNTAIAPEPENFREPTAISLPQPKLAPVDHPREIARLLRSGDFPALNSTLAAWFDADPNAARDWLAKQPDFTPYQPAITQIVGKISCDGDPAHALEWAALLTPGHEQEQSLFDIYALAARNHHFTEAELRAAPLPPERIAELLSGAAGD